MARLLDELLDEHPVVAEAVAGFVLASGETFEGFLVAVGDAQALAAAARTRLDHHRVADLLGDLDGLFRAGDGRVVAWNGVDLGFGRELLRRDLVAHRGDRRVLRADEDNAFFFHAT